MIKAIVTDLDDTLLTRDKTISAFTIKTLRPCRAKGIKIVFATARGTSAKEFIPFALFDGWVMFNGAVAMQGGAVTYQKLINPPVYCPFLQKMSELHIKAPAVISDVHYANFPVAEQWNRPYVMTDFQGLADSAEKLYMLLDSPGQADAVQQWLPDGLYIHFTKDNLALIMHREATKFRVLASLLGDWNIAFSEVAAFGDDVNDMEILQNCGFGIAIENALPEVKKISDDICESCDHHGVARWLSRLIL